MKPMTPKMKAPMAGPMKPPAAMAGKAKMAPKPPKVMPPKAVAKGLSKAPAMAAKAKALTKAPKIPTQPMVNRPPKMPGKMF